MAEGPAVDQTLTPDDAADVLEELLPAQNRSYELGLKLKLPQHVVEAIHSKDITADQYLLRILIKFLQQVNPRPTWRVIVEALKAPSVNLPRLAARVEAAHFPDSTATRDVVPQTTTDTTESAANTTADDDDVKPKPPPQLNPANITAVETEVKGLHERFNALKDLAIKGLQKIGFAVLTVVYILTNIRTHEHRIFLKENHKALRQCEDHLELFGTLNFYWNYLAPDLLDHLIGELTKEHKDFNTTASEMTAYKKDLEEFKKRTTLVLFCEADPQPLDEDPPPGFRKMVVKFDWPRTVTLEDVERFRRRYANSYDLQTCAMMLNSIGTGSFTVTWFVPVSVVEMLTKKRALAVFKEFSVTRLEIHTSTQICVYQIPPQRPVAPSSTSDSSAIAKCNAANKSKEPHQVSSEDEDYPFVEQPSDDFFCPVTMGLLLHPHLTSCCGNHISEEAAARIMGEGGVCPLCKKKDWSTMLNKHFQRQVNSLRVFCRHEDRGCGWQGELGAFHHHVEICPMRDSLPMTELVKLPVYREAGAFPSLSGTISPHSSGTILPVNTKAERDSETQRTRTQPARLAAAVLNAIPPFFKPRKVNRPELHDIEPLYIPGVELEETEPSQIFIRREDVKVEKRSGVGGLSVDDNYMYYSFTENEDKTFLRKCEHNGNFVCDVSLPGFVRGIGKDNYGFLYVLCSSTNSKVFKFDEKLNPVRKTNKNCAEHFSVAYGILVTDEHVFVCARLNQKVCILDLDLNLQYYLKLYFNPIGITKLNDKYFVTAIAAIGILDMDIENMKFRVKICREMKTGFTTERFKPGIALRGICSDNQYLYVTEMDHSNGGRVLCLHYQENQLILKYICRNSCQDCTPNCCPVVIVHHNDTIIYSQGSWERKFHILKLAYDGKTATSEPIIDVV